MSPGQRFGRAQLSAQLALVTYSVSITVLLYLAERIVYEPGDYDSGWMAPVMLIAIYGTGFFPVVVYGAPLYALLAHRNKITIGRTILLGGAPGAVFALLSGIPAFGSSYSSLSFFSTMCVSGVVVALGTHFFATRKFMRPSCP